MIELLTGGVYTLIVTALAGLTGYLIGTRELKRIVDERILKAKPTQTTASPQSGSVKQITPQEIAAAKDDTGNRIKELLSE